MANYKREASNNEILNHRFASQSKTPVMIDEMKRYLTNARMGITAQTLEVNPRQTRWVTTL